MNYIPESLERIVKQMTKEYPVVPVTGRRNPGTELTKVFTLLERVSVPRDKCAVVCMKHGLGAIDRNNYIVPV